MWTKQGKVIAAKFNFTSPSGDWNHFINYYFRENGSLAKIDAQLNTFEGNVSVVRQRYYNSNWTLDLINSNVSRPRNTQAQEIRRLYGQSDTEFT